MIPLKLELTNFLSYRETAALDFEGIHLACISGLNGAGKSSILDGITWALFGRSRSKSDDDIVNRLAALSGEGAGVTLTFSLEGSTYRVIRQKKPRKTTVLELQLVTGPDQWKSLSESRVRDTEAAIESLLRMNYDTFINASFLLQGKADEFTTKTPNRRKEILADLLGLGQWDVFKEAATSRRKQAEVRLALLDGQLEEIQQELAEEPEREEALARAREESAVIEIRVSDKEALLQQLRRVEAAVKQQQQLVKNLADNLERAERTLSDWQQTRVQRQQEMEVYQTILAAADTIVAQFTAWQEAEDAVQKWQAKADEYNRLQQAKRPHELDFAQASSRLEQRRQELENQGRRAQEALDKRLSVAQKSADGKARLDQIDTSLAELGRQEAAWHDARSELQRLQSERRLLEQEKSQLQKQVAGVAAAEKEKPAVEANLQEASRSLADLDARIAALTGQNEQLQRCRADIDTLKRAQSPLREEMDELQDNIQRLETETGGDCPLCGQPLSDTHRVSVLDRLKADGKELGDSFRVNKEQLEKLAVDVARLDPLVRERPRLERDQRVQQQRKASAEARLEAIEEAVAEWQESGGAARLDQLDTSLTDQSLISAQLRRVEELETAAQEKVSLEQERQDTQRQVSEAEASLGEIERTAGEWHDTGKGALTEIERKLESAEYAVEAQAALKEMESQVKAVAYDAEAHETARQSRDALAQAADRHQQLKQAEAAVKPLQDTLADLEKQIGAQERTLSDLKKQRDSAVAELETLSVDGGDLRRVEDEAFRLREEKTAADRRLGAAQQKLEVLDDQRARQKQLTAERADVTQLIRRLKLLEQACGRNGVQALLIEHALPDIEDRANELLERLTGGDMRISFETQKQLKSRDAIAETLDIRIVDNAGERPYANYSGGEQFRVNFAVRLALSQVLAKRAGARLQTLVIDEGFGSQDPTGRQRLVEAINTVRDDFARILVITHIDELRDAFSTRIEVEKTLTGSTISVS
jgi:exonuclease SbcC